MDVSVPSRVIDETRQLNTCFWYSKDHATVVEFNKFAKISEKCNRLFKVSDLSENNNPDFCANMFGILFFCLVSYAPYTTVQQSWGIPWMHVELVRPLK